MSNTSSGTQAALSLPKGGGAIKGIGETFQANLFSGTANHGVPIALSPGRNGCRTVSLAGLQLRQRQRHFRVGVAVGAAAHHPQDGEGQGRRLQVPAKSRRRLASAICSIWSCGRPRALRPRSARCTSIAYSPKGGWRSGRGCGSRRDVQALQRSASGLSDLNVAARLDKTYPVPRSRLELICESLSASGCRPIATVAKIHCGITSPAKITTIALHGSIARTQTAKPSLPHGGTAARRSREGR